MNFSYTIIGVGAIGGYYGAKLASHGADVHFLFHNDYEYVLQHGLRVDSVDGDMYINPAKAYSSVKDLPVTDVVVVALKATQNEVLKDVLPQIVRDNTTVVLMQNGLGGEEYIHDIVPHAHIIGGLCFICSNKVSKGHIVHLDYGAINLGEYYDSNKPKGFSERFEKIIHDFEESAIEVQTSLDLKEARWKKLMWNMPFNGLSVLYGDTRSIMDSQEARSWAEDIMGEVQKGARACGTNIANSFIDKMFKDTDVMKPYRPSMLLDYEAGREMELDAIYKRPIAMALAGGVKMGRTESLYLRLLERN